MFAFIALGKSSNLAGRAASRPGIRIVRQQVSTSNSAHAHRLLSDSEAAELRSSSREFREVDCSDLPAAWKGTSCLITGQDLNQVLHASMTCPDELIYAVDQCQMFCASQNLS